ncbi:hypothetical protein BDV98DRAFT_582863 [Pterulicium gracile]|uniref:Uncharacterized protein n=1 Tax=Pterulicium gracile TaxID=1884261 RepID=A0A5C3QGP4_9AGAR|nr:hypothetical protein BDV98DRAFT_582863 [Pterula gracilis]
MAPNARVWRVYLDEAGHFDADMTQLISRTVKAHGDDVDARILGWLCNASSNASVRTVFVTAVSNLNVGFSARETLCRGIMRYTYDALMGCIEKNSHPDQILGENIIKEGMEKKAYIYLLTLIQLGPRPSPPHGTMASLLYGMNAHHGFNFDCSLEIGKMDQPGSRHLTQKPRFKSLKFIRGDLYAKTWIPSSRVPTSHDLCRLESPNTSKCIWILLLQRAIQSGVLVPFKLGVVRPRRARLDPTWESLTVALTF